MKKILQSTVVSTGLAIFSMLFGAGNIIFPINVGRVAGDHIISAMSGFLLTAILLPIIGLVSILLFDGNYNDFFERLGKIPAFIIILSCMIIIGPLIAMPRIVDLSYVMISPFIPQISRLVFGIMFLTITFLFTFRENKIIDLLGYIISPLLLLSLIIIILKGLFAGGNIPAVNISTTRIFWNQLKYGYNTLDLLGTIFFSSMILSILKATLNKKKSSKEIALIGLNSGIIGTGLLTIIYIGLSLLGLFHGQNLGSINEAEVFSSIAFKVLGEHGAAIVSAAVLLACLSTIVALAAVLTEYLKKDVLKNRLGYIPCLIIILLTTLITAKMGLTTILKMSEPIFFIIYPIIIALTFLNLAYKLFQFKPVKLPVLIVTLLTIFSYLFI